MPTCPRGYPTSGFPAPVFQLLRDASPRVKRWTMDSTLILRYRIGISLASRSVKTPICSWNANAVIPRDLAAQLRRAPGSLPRGSSSFSRSPSSSTLPQTRLSVSLPVSSLSSNSLLSSRSFPALSSPAMPLDGLSLT